MQLCKKNLKYCKSTSSLKNHLKAKHGELVSVPIMELFDTMKNSFVQT